MLFNFPYKLSGRLYVRGNLRLVGLEEQIVVCIVTHDDEVGEQRAILTSKNTSTDVRLSLSLKLIQYLFVFFHVVKEHGVRAIEPFLLGVGVRANVLAYVPSHFYKRK